jgi:hypothetical protein
MDRKNQRPTTAKHPHKSGSVTMGFPSRTNLSQARMGPDPRNRLFSARHDDPAINIKTPMYTSAVFNRQMSRFSCTPHDDTLNPLGTFQGPMIN